MSDGTPAIEHSADYSLLTPSNPAHPGEVILVYATGVGPVSAAVPSGVAASGADPIPPPSLGCFPLASRRHRTGLDQPSMPGLRLDSLTCIN